MQMFLDILQELRPEISMLCSVIISYLITKFVTRKKALERKYGNRIVLDQYDIIVEGKRYPLSMFEVVKKGESLDENSNKQKKR